MSDAKNRSSRATGTQKTMLVDFMLDNKPFARGQFAGTYSRQNNGETWGLLDGQLNAQGPIIKSIEQLKKYWTDIKSSIKKRAAEYKAFLNRTGGGSKVDGPRPLSEFEEKVLSIITIHAIDGDSSTPEAGTPTAEIHEYDYDNLEIELEVDADDDVECMPKPSKIRRTQNIGYSNALEEARNMQASLDEKLDTLIKLNTEILSILKNRPV